MLFRDAVAGLLVGTANAAILVLTWRTLKRADPASPIPILLAATLVVVSATITGCGLLLGALNHLSPAALYALVLLVTAICFIAVHSRIAPLAGFFERPSNMLAASEGNLLPVEAEFRLAVASLGGAWLAHLAVNGLVRLPTDWDSLAYHIPLLDHWIQTGSLYCDDCAFWYVPGNNELLAYWFVAPFSGDFWIHLNNIPSVLLLAASVAALGELLGLCRFRRGIVLTCVLFSQPVIRQIVSAENDVAVAALFVAAVLFGCRYVRSSETRDLILFALAVGVLGGVKYYALGYAAAATAPTVLCLLGRRQFRGSLRIMLAAAAGFALFGAFWYLRNWVMTGSPIYPKGLFGVRGPWFHLRPNFHTSTLLWSGRAEVWPKLFWAWLTQAGPLTALAAIFSPGIVLLVIWLGRNQVTVRYWPMTTIFAAAIYVITPNVVETVSGSMNMLELEYLPARFGLCFLIAALLAAATATRLVAEQTGLDQFTLSAAKSLIATGLAAGIAWQIAPVFGVHIAARAVAARMWSAQGSSLAPELVLLFFDATIGILIASHLACCSSARSRWSVGIGAVLVWAAASGLLSVRWHGDFEHHFARRFHTGVCRLVAESLSPGDRLCICDYPYYPFLGSRRQYSVCRPLWLPEKAALENYLKKESATHVLVPLYDSHSQALYANINEWCAADPARYKLLLAVDRFVLYRIEGSEPKRHR